MAKIIIGNHDGENGHNDSYFIPGRGNIPRKKLVKEVKENKHPDFGIYEYEGEEYIRAKPDNSEANNVNQ